jgi:hypothetical protein
MTKMLHLTIRNCLECPNTYKPPQDKRKSFYAYFCARTGEHMTDVCINTTPDWCPLPDKEPDVKA